MEIKLINDLDWIEGELDTFTPTGIWLMNCHVIRGVVQVPLADSVFIPFQNIAYCVSKKAKVKDD